MSKYTTEVRYICETYAGLSESSGYSNVDDILTKAAPKVFDFDFPIFDEDYRLGLEKKILLNYYTREICEALEVKAAINDECNNALLQ